MTRMEVPFWVQRRISTWEQNVANLTLGTCGIMKHDENTVESILTVSACTDTEATSHHKAIKALPWLSLAWRQVDIPHGASVPQTHRRLGDPNWWTLPSSVLHTILRASVHLSNLLYTFWIIILLSNVQSHIHPFLFLYIIFFFIHKIFTELRYSHGSN